MLKMQTRVASKTASKQDPILLRGNERFMADLDQTHKDYRGYFRALRASKTRRGLAKTLAALPSTKLVKPPRPLPSGPTLPATTPKPSCVVASGLLPIERMLPVGLWA